MNSTHILVLLALLAGFVHCFPWDIVAGEKKQLHFYYNETLKHTEEFPLVTRITSVTYDPVHYRVLFSDVNYPIMSIYSFDISTRKTKSLFTKTSVHDRYVRVVYDPVTQLLVWKERRYIYTFSLNHASCNKAVGGNLLFTLDYYSCRDIAVDSCGGHIYWTTSENIERARLDGSKREVVVNSSVYFRLSLAIDQQTQRMYWIDRISVNGGFQEFIESSNFNGKNKTTLYHYVAYGGSYACSLAVSKDFIYWLNDIGSRIGQLPKNSPDHIAKKLYSISSSQVCDISYQLEAANYTIQEQIQGIKNCEALQYLISKPESTVSICQNYCLEGDCCINAEGQPTCSSKTEGPRERCEVNKCYNYCLHNGVCSLNKENEPVCQCTVDSSGRRCEISICKEYCLKGNCSLSTEGQPTCSCEAGYFGERCEVDACHKHCLNNGICSLNEEDEPFCECTADYEGERCDVAITQAGDCAGNTTQQVLRDMRNRILQLFSDNLDEDEAMC